jgi:hypothetical protein
MSSTLLGSIVARLESNNSGIDGPAAGYANFRYQQFPGFVSQYGASESGVLNYASQVLKANPNATFGDFYGGYVTGTGNPANASVNSLLTTTQPGAQGAYSNMVNNAGIPANTPLASLFTPSAVPAGADNVSSGLSAGGGLSGGTLGDSITGQSSVFDSNPDFGTRFGGINDQSMAGLSGGTDITSGDFAGNTPTQSFDPNPDLGPSTESFDPNIQSTIGPATAATPDTSAIGNPAGDVGGSGGASSLPSGAAGAGTPIVEGLQPGLVADIGKWISNIESAFGSGLNKALSAGGNAVANYFGGITNWFVRAFLIILGIGLILVGLLRLTGGDKIVIETAKGALAAA